MHTQHASDRGQANAITYKCIHRYSDCRPVEGTTLVPDLVISNSHRDCNSTRPIRLPARIGEVWGDFGAVEVLGDFDLAAGPHV